MRLCTFDKTKLSDIFFFEADRNYTTVYYGNGSHDVYSLPLKRFHEFLLHEPGFVRIHRSYLVNRRFIKTIASDHIQLDNGQLLPVARRRGGMVFKISTMSMEENKHQYSGKDFSLLTLLANASFSQQFSVKPSHRHHQ